MGDAFKSASVFRGTFCNGAVELVLKSDQGQDVNLMPPTVVQRISKSKSQSKVEDLKEPPCYGTIATNGPKVTCCQKVENQIILHVLHGNTLALQNMEWIISGDQAKIVLIGEPVLRAIGLDNKKLLEASCDRHSGTIDIVKLLKKFEDD